MARWDIQNRLMKVSHAQFVDYTSIFQEAAELTFGKTQLDISAMSSVRVASSLYIDDILDSCERENAENTLLTTQSLSKLTLDVWDKAAYVDVNITPLDADTAPTHVYANAEFKGTKPKQATFYVSAGGEDAKQHMLSRVWGKRIGDGMDGNTELFAPSTRIALSAPSRS